MNRDSHDFDLDSYVDDWPEQPDWSDVLSRTRRARHRAARLAVFAVALVVVPSALAAPSVRHIFEGSPAPPAVARAFDAENRAARLPPTITREPGFRAVEVKTAHGVLSRNTLGGRLYLWAAQERNGRGECWFITWQVASRGNRADASRPGCDVAKPASPIVYSYSWEIPTWATAVLLGRVYGDASRVAVRYGCGATRTVPVVEHLFLTTFLWGTRVYSISAQDSSGRVTATQQVPWLPSPGGPQTPNRGTPCPATAVQEGPLATTGTAARSPVVAVALTNTPKANPPGRIIATANGYKPKPTAKWHIPLVYVQDAFPSRFPPSSRGQVCPRGVLLQIWFKNGTTRAYGPCIWPVSVRNLAQEMLDQLGLLELKTGLIKPPG